MQGSSDGLGIQCGMASRELIRRAKFLEGHELSKQGPIPRWFVDWAKEVPSNAV